MDIQNFLEIQIKLKKEFSRKQNVAEKKGEQKDSIENNKKLNDIILHGMWSSVSNRIFES